MAQLSNEGGPVPGADGGPGATRVVPMPCRGAGSTLKVPNATGLAIVATLIALAVAWRTQPIALYDDFGITARYASRVASGDGWTYNPGDRTNGASAPLYTMLLALLRLAGLEIVDAARGVGIVSYAGCIGMVAYAGTRLVGALGGCFAAFFLLVWPDFNAQGLSGMESAFAAALGLSVIVAIVDRRNTLAGVLLGLALLTKLDAGLLALAAAIAWMVVKREVPWRLAALSAGIVLPWVAFSAVYFGSPLPNSMTSKLSGTVDNPSIVFDRTWVIDSLRDQRATILILLAVASLVVAGRLWASSAHLACGLVTAFLWPLLHVTTFSLVDFGDRFPWYLTVLYPPIALCAGATLGWLVSEASHRSRDALIVALAFSLCATAFAVGVQHGGGTPRILARRVQRGYYTSNYLEFEKARREAGRRVAALAESGDVIATCFGWVAFEALDNPIHETCELNTREPVGPVRWVVVATYPGRDAPDSLGFNAVPVETIFPPRPFTGRMDIGRVEAGE